MPLGSHSYNTFHGLQPGLGHTQVAELGVIRGKNFRYQLSGPFSGWGNRIVSPVVPDLDGYPWIATFRLLDHTVLCTPTGIWEQCSPCADWTKVIAITPKVWTNCDDNNYPWTQAFVGGSWFFSHPTVGIIEYDKDLCQWSKLDLTCSTDESQFHNDQYKAGEITGQVIAEPIYGITQADGRLVVLAYDTVSWSDIDNGKALDCNLYTGAGFQNLSVAKFGIPVGVYETPDEGFNVYTTNGMFHAVPTGNAASYHVKRVTGSILPLSPYAIINHDSRMQFYLSESGLYATDGSYPKPWGMEVGKWIAEKLITRTNMKRDKTSFRLFHHPESNELWISFGSTYVQAHNIFTNALVYHEDYKQWSSFDQDHRFVGPVNSADMRNYHNSYGFIDPDGHMRHFDLSRYNGQPGIPLDSYIDLGFIQAPSQTDYQHESVLLKYTVHGGPAASDPQDRAWLSQPSKPDAYEETTAMIQNYTTYAMSTHDGYTIPNGQWDASIPVDGQIYTQTYSCYCSGLSHIINISAKVAGQFYEVTRLDVQLNANQ